MNKKLVAMLVFALLTVCPLLAPAQGISDDFTGTTIDTNNWVVTPGGGTITQNDVLTMTGPGGWSQTYMVSASTFPRTVPGGYLRFTMDISGTNNSHFEMAFYAQGVVPADNVIDYGFYYNSGTGTGAALNPKQGGSQVSHDIIPWADPTQSITVRCTLHFEEGALWEVDKKAGAGWETLWETCGGGGDTASEYAFFLMAFGDAYVVDNVVIDYAPWVEGACYVPVELSSFVVD